MFNTQSQKPFLRVLASFIALVVASYMVSVFTLSGVVEAATDNYKTYARDDDFDDDEGEDDDDEEEAEEREKPKFSPSLRLRLPTTTQGPFWPPSAMMDENGNFVLVGISLNEGDNGQIEMMPMSAKIVSKDTTPPLDDQGREDFSNPFGASYLTIRDLDLSSGSSDLDIELFTNSYGPAIGDFGGGPRIPKQGDSVYNLNGFSVNGDNCPELYPTQSQRVNYIRDSFPLVDAPIPGFQGDGVSYDVESGEQVQENTKNGADCPPQGCEGEDTFHFRRAAPITLGEWLKAKVNLTITLTKWSRKKRAFTAARFQIKAKNLLPNSLYSVVALRQSFLVPSPLLKLPTPATPTSHFVTDKRGRATLTFEMKNPFPSPEQDNAGLRVIGMGVAFKSDFSITGACSLRFGAGVDIHAQAVSTADGTFDFTDFVTAPM